MEPQPDQPLIKNTDTSAADRNGNSLPQQDGSRITAFNNHGGQNNSRPVSQNRMSREPVGGHQAPILEANRETASKPRLSVLKIWWPELSASLIFLIALLAILVTLYPHQNAPLPQWPYHISVNSLLSVYAVFLKGAILLVVSQALGQLKWTWFTSEHPLDDLVRYDEASRGALSSLKLLWRLRLQHPLASCGALISIILLAVDPFIQQTLSYYDCSVSIETEQANLPRTNFFSPFSYHDQVLIESILPSI